MVVGGMQKTSLIDFPGKISCVLFLDTCNFRCPYCQNPDLVYGNKQAPIDPDDVYLFLERRKEFLDGVVISGGEPTLQSDLLSLCQIIKGMGYAVKLDTNGSRPETVRKLVESEVLDYIAMDIKTDPHAYAPILQKESHPEDILSSVEVIMGSVVPHEFRTTCVRPFVDRRVVDGISRRIEGSMLYALQRFSPRTVLNPAFFRETDRSVDDDELAVMKQIAENNGVRCIIR